MEKVFIVTSGCYSDYQIEAVFSTREKAEAYINAKGTDDWEVSEWDVDAEITKCHDAIYDISINNRDGNITINGRSEQGHGWDYEFGVERKDCFLYDGSHIIRMWLESDSLERAKKVASERWMQIKALQPVVFPYLYKRVVDDRRHFGLPYHEYPMYNFFTKEIVLSDTQKLDIDGKDGYYLDYTDF